MNYTKSYKPPKDPKPETHHEVVLFILQYYERTALIWDTVSKRYYFGSLPNIKTKTPKIIQDNDDCLAIELEYLSERKTKFLYGFTGYLFDSFNFY